MSSEDSAPSTRLPPAFWVLWLGGLVNQLGGFVTPFLALYLTQARGVSTSAAGYIAAMLGAGGILGAAAGGYAADRWGRRKLLLLGTLGSGTMLWTLGTVQSIAAIGACVFFLGLTNTMTRVAIDTMVTDLVPAEGRAKAFTLTSWASNLGAGFAMLSGGWLAERGYKWLFMADAATAFAFAAIALSLPETRPPLLPKHEQLGITKMLRPFADRSFLEFAVLVLPLALLFQQVFVALPLDMKQRGLSSSEIGRLLSLNCVLIVIFQPLVSRFIDRIPRTVGLAGGAFLVAVGLGMSGMSSMILRSVSIAIWTAGETLAVPLIGTVVAAISPVNRRGEYQGAFITAYSSVSSLLGPVIGCALLAHLGSEALWSICLVVGVVVAVGFLMGPNGWRGGADVPGLEGLAPAPMPVKSKD